LQILKMSAFSPITERDDEPALPSSASRKRPALSVLDSVDPNVGPTRCDHSSA
jgi:hypothetical protein